MTVLVTGASGFIGQAVIRHLDAAGLRTRRISRRRDAFGSIDDTVALPPAGAPQEAFEQIMTGISHVVHCAALNNDSEAASQADFHAANAVLTSQLAHAAAEKVSGRFVYLSSIRAVAGADFNGTIRADTEPLPSCAYGRSKREGETGMLAAYSHRQGSAAALRLPPVYGREMRGNLAALMRLADSSLPLPLAGLGGRRSLISLESVGRAVLHLITTPALLQPVYLASDAAPVSIADVVAAYREGLGRPKRLFAMPRVLLAAIATVAGKQQLWQSLTTTQICDPSPLVSSGWHPETDTAARLTELARLIKSRDISLERGS